MAVGEGPRRIAEWAGSVHRIENTQFRRVGAARVQVDRGRCACGRAPDLRMVGQNLGSNHLGVCATVRRTNAFRPQGVVFDSDQRSIFNRAEFIATGRFRFRIGRERSSGTRRRPSGRPHLSSSAHAHRIIVAMRRRLVAAQTRNHSPATLSSPRRLTVRKPSPCLIQPNGASAMCLRGR